MRLRHFVVWSLVVGVFIAMAGDSLAAHSLIFTKTADATTVNAGAQVGYTLSVTNGGPAALTQVQITDTLPSTAGTSWSISPARAGCQISGGVLRCSFGRLAKSASASVHIVSPTTAASCGTISNSASARSASVSVGAGPATIQVNCAAIEVVKTADASTVSAGDQIGFTVTLSNPGSGQATGLVFSDALPAGLAWSIDPASTGWVIVGGNLAYSPNTLAPGASSSVHVVATTDSADCGTITNTATVTSSNDGQDSSSATVEVNCAAIEVAKTADASSVSAGDQVGFTVTVSNLGSGELKDPTVSDPLPAGLAWTIDPASTGWVIAGDTLFYSASTLAPGASSSVHVVATTDSADCGTITNGAIATSSNDGQDSSSATVDVKCAVIDVVKTFDAGSVSAGDQVGFTVTVSNQGSGELKDPTVTDPLPAGLDWTISPASAGWSISGPVGAESLTYSASTLAPGASSSVHVIATTDSADCGTITNTAIATSSNDGLDTSSATVDVNCVSQADLSITKTDGSVSYVPGGNTTYTIVVANSGPSAAATGVSVVNLLPVEIASAVYTAVSTGGATGFTASGGGSINDTGIQMPVGSTITYALTATISQFAVGNLVNTATVSPPAGTTDPNPSNNTATDSDASLLRPTFRSLRPTAQSAIDWRQYHVHHRRRHSGPSAAATVTVVDLLPVEIALPSTPRSARRCDRLHRIRRRGINDTGIQCPLARPSPTR